VVIRGFIGWNDEVKAKGELLCKNHEVELALVRSGWIRTFSSIRSTTSTSKDPLRASAYLNELSDLMRFVLYGARQERIPLSEELRFIEKYIRLEQIRVAQSGFIAHQVEGNPGSISEIGSW
jgi:hypothetical protein